MPFRIPKSRFWQFDFQLEGYRFFGSTKRTDEGDAQTFEKERRIEAQRFVDAARARGQRPLDLGDAAARWHDEHGQYLAEDVKTTLDWIVEFLGARTPMHQISDDLVAQIVTARRKHRREAGTDEKGKQLWRPIAPTTVNKTTTLLRRVMRRARDNWNAAIFTEPKWRKHMLPEIKRPIREITHAEEAAIDAIDSVDYADVRRFAIITGLRLGEVLLTWPQVDLENSVIRIVGKGDKPAILPLSREAYEILWRQRGRHPLHVFTYVQHRNNPRDKKIAGQRYPITYWGLANRRRRKWTKAGVAARFHDTRHTTGMRTLRATGNLRVTQSLLRHSDIKTTAKFYTDAMLDDVRNAMEATAKAQPPALPTPVEKIEGSE